LSLLVEAVDRIAGLRREIRATTGRDVSHVDIGGGLSTVYQSGQTCPTPGAYREQLERRSPELFSQEVRLVTEFGRAIHANCGLAVSRVEYVKPAQRLAVIHLGADFLLRPVYRSENWKHEFFVLDRHGMPKIGTATAMVIAGPLCFGGDIIGRDVLLPPIEPEDWIVIRDVGAYTLSMWSRHCSRAIPKVLGYDSTRSEPVCCLRREETPADIVRFWGGDLPSA
jgi:diaminopimelate decarboxylase